MKSILHICPAYFLGELHHNLFQTLENFGVKNIVYVPTKGENSRNLPYRVETFNKQFNLFERFLYYRKQNAIYEDLSKKEYLSDVEIIHTSTLFTSGNVARRLYQKKGIPYIVTVENTDINLFFKYMPHLRKLGISILKDAYKVIFLSDSYKNLVVSKYVPQKLHTQILEKSIVIPLGINPYFLDNKNKVKTHNKNVIKVLYLGRIEANKNIGTTIKACLYLQKLGYKIEYTVIGQITYNFFKKLTHYPFITRYPNITKKEELISHMRRSDIFVMPSIFETFGLVYPESMSQGLPIIYTRGQGFDGYFPDGEVGYAVDCFNHKEIAEKIIAILSNYEFMSRKCIENVDIFDWKKIAREYISIYNYRKIQ